MGKKNQNEKNSDIINITTHKRQFHDYEIIEKFEAGIALKGQEVKSIRAKHIELKNSYARVIHGQLYLLHCHIRPYEHSRIEALNPERDRKLLMHRREIVAIEKKIKLQGLVLLPLSVYIRNNNVKIQLGLGRPKKRHDKRAELKSRTEKRSINQAVKSSWKRPD